jgi:hypothetical protein
MMLPWEAVKSLDWDHNRISVEDLTAGKPASAESLTKEVLLRRDVIDALVLDLEKRSATRANDLWLEEEDGQLVLKAADTSARAIVIIKKAGHGTQCSALAFSACAMCWEVLGTRNEPTVST